MIKAFILVLIFQSSDNSTSLHSIEFTSRQSCEAGKVVFFAKYKHPKFSDPSVKDQGLNVSDAFCIEK